MPLVVTQEVAGDPASLQAALLGLVAANRVQMRERRLPDLYTTPVVYRREPLGAERWQSAQELLARGEGDCEDLSAYRAAYLQEYEAEPAIAQVVRTARGTYHARVQRGDGTIEDPSRILLDREGATKMKMPVIRLKSHGDQCLGAIVLPLDNGGTIRTEHLGFSMSEALRAAARVASSIVNDPAIAPLLGPHVTAAVKVASRLSSLSRDALIRAIPTLSPSELAVARGLLRVAPAAEPEPEAVEGRWERGPDGRHVWIDDAAMPPPVDPYGQAYPYPYPHPTPQYPYPHFVPYAQQYAPPQYGYGYGYGHQVPPWLVPPPPGSAMADAEEEVPDYVNLADPSEAAAVAAWGAGSFDRQ